MSNTSNQLAEKGSKYWMQKIVNKDSLKIHLEQQLNEANLRWYSPLESESYKEYQLKKSQIMENVLGLDKSAFADKFSFWPSNEPHWDAIATSCDGSILYLFEAKANIDEIRSSCSASSEESKKLIEHSMKEVYEAISDTSVGNFSSWFNKYYQMGNRLTFVYKMNHMDFPKIKNVKLVLLNIVDDKTYIPISQKEWKQHYNSVFKEMIGKEEPPKNTIVLYFSGKE